MSLVDRPPVLSPVDAESVEVRCDREAPAGWNAYLARWGYDGFHLSHEWAQVFLTAFRHRPWFLWAERHGVVVGVLPLVHVRGPIFGSFLVSQPYLNTGGVLADSTEVESVLVGRAVALADELGVKHLELRHEREVSHARLNATNTDKVHMRLALPASADTLWDGLKSKLRSQIRKPLNDTSLQVRFGRHEHLEAFYEVFCRNMRDLGTPPFSKKLFRSMLDRFGDAAEVALVQLNGRPVAAAFLLHGPEVTLIPSASALREHNSTNCNMLMYWHCLKRSIERGQTTFDFGRSSHGSGTHRFKQQWGAIESPAVWQYYVRSGGARDMRPDSGKYDRVIKVWQRLPVWLTRWVGPEIVRGIP
jgi:serine/alanine adding enzyme